MREDDFTISVLDLDVLDAPSLAVYDQMTEERFRVCLRGKDPWDVADSEIIAVHAAYHSEPAALALAGFRKHVKLADLHSIFVAEPYRNHHVATRLIQKIEEELKKRKCLNFSFSYQTELPTTPIYEKILKNLGWADSTLFMVKCTFDGFKFNPPWIQRTYDLPEGYEIFPWKDLKPEELQRLLELDRQGNIPFTVSPFNHADIIEPLNSLGLRYKGEVVGWMVTHRLAPDTIDYAALYVERDCKYVGAAMALLVRAIHIQKKSTVKWAVLAINVNLVEQKYLSSLRRRYIPYADKVERIRRSVHELRGSRKE